MKKTGFKAAIFVVLVITILAGQAIAGPGGSGRGRGGGGGQGWGQGMAGGPRMGANPESVRPDNFRGSRGPYCPNCQGPIQNIQGGQGKGMAMQGRGGRGFQGRGMAMQGRGGRGFQGRGMAMHGRSGRGFPGRSMAMQGRSGRGFPGRGMAMQGRGGRSFPGRSMAMQGRGDRGFQGRGMEPQGRGMSGRRGQPGPGGMGRLGPDMHQHRFAPEDTGQTNQPMPPRGEGWAPGSGPGWRQGRGPGWGPDPQHENAPDTNAPATPVVKDQIEKPQGE